MGRDGIVAVIGGTRLYGSSRKAVGRDATRGVLGDGWHCEGMEDLLCGEGTTVAGGGGTEGKCRC